jgi:hypothetical protein
VRDGWGATIRPMRCGGVLFLLLLQRVKQAFTRCCLCNELASLGALQMLYVCILLWTSTHRALNGCTNT